MGSMLWLCALTTTSNVRVYDNIVYIFLPLHFHRMSTFKSVNPPVVGILHVVGCQDTWPLILRTQASYHLPRAGDDVGCHDEPGQDVGLEAFVLSTLQHYKA